MVNDETSLTRPQSAAGDSELPLGLATVVGTGVASAHGKPPAVTATGTTTCSFHGHLVLNADGSLSLSLSGNITPSHGAAACTSKGGSMLKTGHINQTLPTSAVPGVVATHLCPAVAAAVTSSQALADLAGGAVAWQETITGTADTWYEDAVHQVHSVHERRSAVPSVIFGPTVAPSSRSTSVAARRWRSRRCDRPWLRCTHRSCRAGPAPPRRSPEPRGTRSICRLIGRRPGPRHHVSLVVLDDHLLRDVLSGEQGGQLGQLVESNELATTNLYYVRLCKSVVSARGGALTGGWTTDRRRELGRRLLELPDSVLIPPMRLTGYRVAELAEGGRISTLGAEAVAVAEYLHAALCVWEGDDGPGIRSAASSIGVTYRTISLSS